MPLATLPPDELMCIMKLLPAEDRLTAALACKPMRDECISLADDERGLDKRWITAGTSSFARLKWAVEVMGATPDIMWCCAAAERGDEMMVCYIHYGLEVAWGDDVCAAAASGGHVDLLKWLHSKGCPWDELTCAHAARGGYLTMLQWMRSQDPPCPWNESVCIYAAQGGHLTTLQWLRSQDPPCPWSYHACSFAAESGQLTTLQWLRSQGCVWDKDECLKTAKKGGYIAMAEWIRGQDA